MTVDVAIIESGGANIASLELALERAGIASRRVDTPAGLRAATHVILPGVGAARDSMARLGASGLAAALRALRQPVLGICLGMQLLCEHSEEGATPCLGLLPGRVQRIVARAGLPVPHMGWNRLWRERAVPLLESIEDGAYVYFVHSFALPPGDHTIASTDYGGRFSAAVSWRNFHGVQFHPERSAAVGATILRNFLRLEPWN